MTSTPDRPLSVAVSVPDEAGLAGLAAQVAAVLPLQSLVTLAGDLGAGKTTFVKHVAAALGIDPADVVSPTFGLIHVHAGPRSRLVHADFYRLSSGADLRETGWEDALVSPRGQSCHAFVEWPERIAAELPAARLDVAITIDSETARTLTFTARSAAYEPIIRALAAALQAPPARGEYRR